MLRLNLPVLTIIFNNDILGWIKHRTAQALRRSIYLH